MARSPVMVVYLPVSLSVRRRGAVGDDIPNVLQSTTSSALPSSGVQAGMISHYLDQYWDITSNRFMLNMFKDHCL